MLRHLALSSYPGLDKQPESQDREKTKSKSSADCGGAEGPAPAKALEPDRLRRQLSCSTVWPQDSLASMQSRVIKQANQPGTAFLKGTSAPSNTLLIALKSSHWFQEFGELGILPRLR